MVKFDNTFENNPIKIGQNAIDNDNIISEAKEADIWFHLKTFPSCHVIIECSNEYPINLTMIIHCANLVKQNTKYKNVPNVKVNYTPIKNIHKTDTPGLVIIKGKAKNIVC